MKKLFYLSACVLLMVSACKNHETKLVEREDLFTIQYGNFDNEINLSKMDRNTYSVANIYLNNGIFYLSNTTSKKVIKTSFYGDLLALYYNSEYNPKPDFVPAAADEPSNNQKSLPGTRTAVEYPFNSCSFLVVNEMEHLYVVDRVPTDRIQIDNEQKIALTDVILHFDNNGNFIDYIGQEGLGGTPFPNIVSLSTNAKNDVIAVCKTLNSMNVFWFTADGVLVSRTNFDINALPFSYEPDREFHMNIDAIFPSYESRDLYIKIDYYVDDIDGETGANLGIDYDKSSVYKVSLDKGEFQPVKDINPYKIIDENDTIVGEKVYMLMNVCKDDWAFLMTKLDDAFAILLLNLKTGKTKKLNLSLKNFSPLFSTFTVTPDCMLAGLFGDENEATVSVWHTENVIR